MNDIYSDSQPRDELNSNNVKLYTLQEAAQLLRRKPNWLYTKTKENAIPHRRFGKYIVFTETDIAAIIAMSLRGPGEPEKAALLAG